jgi:glutathione peroxidase-family protein
MEIVIMKHNWEEFKKGNAGYLRALNGEEIKFYNRLGESLVELNVAETSKLAPAYKYLDCTTQWLNAAYNVVDLPQKMMLNWLSAVRELGHISKG